MMLNLTPIRIRGKKGALPEEKWTYGRKRPRPTSPSSESPSQGSDARTSSSQVSEDRTRKRKRRRIEPSRLEELPTEMLQEIFELSENLNLPLASTRLARQLSNKHLYSQLTTRILEKVLGVEHTGQDTQPDFDDLHAAARLLDSRFMTWSFFTEWLDVQAGVERESEEHEQRDYKELWIDLDPSPVILLPQKLLRGPWTEDSVNFLRCLTPRMYDIGTVSLYHADLAQEGLSQAITEKCTEAVRLLFEIGVRSSQELVRQAVIDDGCIEDIVNLVVQFVEYQESYDPATQSWIRHSQVDTLDPVLWRWIDQSIKDKNPKGAWFKEVLHSLSRPIDHQRTFDRQLGLD